MWLDQRLKPEASGQHLHADTHCPGLAPKSSIVLPNRMPVVFEIRKEPKGALICAVRTGMAAANKIGVRMLLWPDKQA